MTKAKLEPTKGQFEQLLQCHRGVGLLMYHSGQAQVTYTEFFIKAGKPYYIESGTPVEFTFDGEE